MDGEGVEKRMVDGMYLAVFFEILDIRGTEIGIMGYHA